MTTSHVNLANQLKAARRVSVPIIAIATPDPAQTIRMACAAINGDSPKLVWDIANGLSGINDEGKVAAADVDCEGTIGNPMGLFLQCQKLKERSVVFVHMASRFLADVTVLQAIWNLRDAFKSDGRMVVLLGSSFDLPAELSNDVLLMDEPLPTPDELREIVDETTAAADLDCDGQVVKAVEAVQGLSSFAAEQSVAMSLTKQGIDLDGLWERKRKQIEQAPALKVFRDGQRFSDIGGCDNIKQFLTRLANGPERPNAVVFLDEIEKSLAGQGDTSGVSQDQLGVILTEMQDRNYDGCIFIGPPGAAKSACAKSLGNECGVPTLQLDLGSAKGSLVGQSEGQIRQAMKVIHSVSNGKALWIATCNSIGNLPPELRRRFSLGTYFFDLPQAAERGIIWGLYIQQFNIPKKHRSLVDDAGWTGAEIRTCCRLSNMLGLPLSEAASYIVPVAKSASETIERLRVQADRKFISASYPGVYRKDYDPATEAAATGRRKLSVE